MLLHGLTATSLKFSSILVLLYLSTSFAYRDERLSEFPRVVRLPKIFYQLQKRDDDQGYFEQCRFVNPWNRQLGYVNVFAFLNLAWTYSYRQAIMLRILKKRLEKAGFSDVWFFVIVAPPDMPDDKSEDEIEIETWRKIHAFDSHDILNSAEVVLNDIESDIESDIIFIQDNSNLGIWESFRASKNQIVIVDRCGKLTYQVIIPWSILYFPYVKAAILSTYKEDPCGPCTVRPILRPMDYEEYLFSNAGLNQTTAENSGSNQESKAFHTNSKSTLVQDPIDSGYKKNVTTTSFDNTGDSVNNETRKEVTEGATEYPELIDVTALPTQQAVPVTEMNERGPFAINISTHDSREEIHESTTLNTPLEEPCEVEASVFKLNSSHIEENTYNSKDRSNINDDNVPLETSDDIRKDNFNGPVAEEIIPLHKSEERHSEEAVQDSSNILPIRVIMRVPHLHEENGKYKKYTTVVLKTGSPEYHQHYDVGKDIPSAVENSGHYESGDGFHDPTLLEYIYNRDESPGLYGEVADYWKNYDDDEYVNKNPSGGDYEDTTPSDTIADSNSGTDNNNPKISINGEDTEHDVGELNRANKNGDRVDANTNDDEAKQRLIDHYKKLLPWVYYVL